MQLEMKCNRGSYDGTLEKDRLPLCKPHVQRAARTAAGLLLLAVLLGAASPAWSGDKSTAPARTPKIREVVEIPEDFVGQTFTFKVRITTQQTWMRRGNNGDFFLFVKDLEGSQLPNTGISPDSSVNLLRFVLPKEEGRKLFDRLNASKFYEANIRFTIDREREIVTGAWRYLAKISSIELT